MRELRTGAVVETACPQCGSVEPRTVYDVGSGPELCCGQCEWCWGAEGQDLKPLATGVCTACGQLMMLEHGLVIGHPAGPAVVPGVTARVCRGAAKPPRTVPA